MTNDSLLRLSNTYAKLWKMKCAHFDSHKCAVLSTADLAKVEEMKCMHIDSQNIDSQKVLSSPPGCCAQRISSQTWSTAAARVQGWSYAVEMVGLHHARPLCFTSSGALHSVHTKLENSMPVVHKLSIAKQHLQEFIAFVR